MRKLCLTLLLFTLIQAGCATPSTEPADSQSQERAREAAVQTDVRAFAQTVAHDVTQEGPTAWRRYLADSPAFFMAVNGSMLFPNSAAATAGIQAFAPTIKHIELKWGDDLRVDPIAPNLAVVASTYHEIQVGTDGKTVDSTGFFTGTAEFQGGRWQFRNAHWSMPLPEPSSK